MLAVLHMPSTVRHGVLLYMRTSGVVFLLHPVQASPSTVPALFLALSGGSRWTPPPTDMAGVAVRIAGFCMRALALCTAGKWHLVGRADVAAVIA